MADRTNGSELERLAEANKKSVDWKNWGPYVSDRAWGTVREDYSPDGSAWDYFPFEDAHRRTFRWNEDGIAGICDRNQRLCFGLALWNGKDAILKERLFGLSGTVGNHGEDVKEYYYYLDNTPTHSYMKFLYKYPQEEFPYKQIYEENAKRDKSDPEYELIDTGVFDVDRYFDVFVEYAKAGHSNIYVKITAVNRGDNAATIHLLPTVWFRNTWSWSAEEKRPVMSAGSDGKSIELKHTELGDYVLTCDGSPELLFCENESNNQALFNSPNTSPFTKDGIGEYIVSGDSTAVNPAKTGTKGAAHYASEVAAGGSYEIILCLRRQDENADLTAAAGKIFDQRIAEADEYYESVIPNGLSADAKNVMRQSIAGMLWSKQFYHYAVKTWLDGDPACPPPPKERLTGRNSGWKQLYNDDVISMPDKWEYPWYAAWDLAFHCVGLAMVDAEFAKRQLVLMLREWYMHPNGQIPAYEWAFGDVNPPVHAWAALRVYLIDAKRSGTADRPFLEKVFHKLLLNFTWWVNRKDDEGDNVFEGGFLGLDNIGVFDRSKELPSGTHLEQSDGTSWMAMYSLNMLAIALELAREDPVYEDVATKFFEHFVYISDAMNNVGKEDNELWNEEDGFYYDVLQTEDGQIPIRLRSMVGLIPLFAVSTVEANWLDDLPNFKRRTEWFLSNRTDLTDRIGCMQRLGQKGRLLLSLVNEERLLRVLKIMLAEDEFLSPHGVRALSRRYRADPFEFQIGGTMHRVDYEPGESRSGMFGGNSNWRGPVWFPVNYLLIESLQKFDYYFGDELKVEFPTGSGKMMDLWNVSLELERRLCSIFLRDENGQRPAFGDQEKFQNDENWRDNLLFYEYFHGDNGSGLGASHQTGWTGLVGKILQQLGNYETEGIEMDRGNMTMNMSSDELIRMKEKIKRTSTEKE